MNHHSGYSYGLVLITLLLVGCSSKVMPSNSSRPYDLDLASYRPAYKVDEKVAPVSSEKKTTPAVVMTNQPLDVTKKLDTMLDTLARGSRSSRYLNGYRIQLYTGSKRNEMESAKMFVYQSFAELNTYIAYNHPTYRLRVGDFPTRLDVERYFQKIKEQYPEATIVSDRVALRDALKIIDNRTLVKD